MPIVVPLIAVPFLGTTIFVTNEVVPRVPMRPIVEGLGLSWSTQVQKLNAARKRWSVSMIDTVGADGKEREMLGIPLRRLFAWLAGITAGKVKPDVRPALERYQEECDHVLEQHWTRVRQGLPVPLAPGEEPTGTLMETIYGPSRAAGDMEAERLAAIVLRAREAGRPFRQEAAAAERAMRALGYDKDECRSLIGRVKRQIAAITAQPPLPLLGG